MASRATILFKTQGGLTLFQLLLPKLVMNGGRNKTNIDSPISKGKNCFSVYFSKQKYLFKDHHTNVYGDIFELVAIINNLNSKTEFIQVLEIIERMLESSMATIPENEKLNYVNRFNEDLLCLVSLQSSEAFVNKNFMQAASYLEYVPSYPIQVVDSFELNERNVFYEFDFSKPDETFYAIVIRKEQYYILFNPKTHENFEWGQRPEFYAFGLDALFKNAYVKNIYLRDSIVITNKVEGVLWCEDNGIPCLGLLNNEMLLTDFLQEVVLSKFTHKYLMFHEPGEGKKQMGSFVSNYDYKVINTMDGNLYQFINRGDEATDKVFEDLYHSEGYEILELKNPVERFVETEF